MKLVFSAVLLLLCSSLQLAASARFCSLDTARNDCGYDGITKSECIGASRDCCWDPKENEPWCFTKTGGTECYWYLPRLDCGYLGITQEQCEDRGCCYNDDPIRSKDKPWCFQKSERKVEGCELPDKPREDCGEVGTTETECEESDCCWYPAEDLPWCFKKTFPTDSIDCDKAFDRSECGYVGIDKVKCEARGCCWDPVYGDRPWCFHKHTGEPQCFPNKPREDCGGYSTTQEQCEEKGCCWTPSDVPGRPWCYEKLDPVTELECFPDPKERVDCGEVGTTEEQCEAKGCCWDPSYDQPWCYERTPIQLPERFRLPEPVSAAQEVKGHPVDEISDEKLSAMIMEELVQEVREEMNAKSKGR